MLRSNRSAARSTKQLTGGCAVLFGLPFILAGLAVGVFLYFPAISSWWASRSWVEVPCWIETAELKTSSGNKGGTTYRVEASYRYEFGRRSYHGDEVSFFGGSDNMGDFQKQAFQQLQSAKGKKRPFRCFVNPSNPEQTVLFRDLRWGLLLLMSIFPTLFPLAGCLVSIGGWRQSRRTAQIARLREQYPGAPWCWRPEWLRENIYPEPNPLPFILGVAGWILLVQLPLALAVILGGEIVKSALALLTLIPVALALIPLLFAWRRIKSQMVFGRPVLQLKQVPVSPGHPLVGELRFSKALSPLSTLSVRVLCQRHITRNSGDSHATAKETIWEHTTTLSAAEARRDVDGVALPLRIDIPRGLPCAAVNEASIVSTEGEQHVWTLEISSSQGGRPVVLPLPVFISATAAADAEGEEGAAFAQPEPAPLLSTDDLLLRLKARGIEMEMDAGGMPTFIDCPAGRNLYVGLFLLLFGLIWSAGFLFMQAKGAPLIFRLFWGITSPLILVGSAWTLLHSLRLEINARELRILNRMGPFYSWQEIFEPRHITGFTHDSNTQAGNKFYYRVRAETIFGKTKTLVDGITESVTAETLARRLDEWRKQNDLPRRA
ncbi:MAG: DUF3592 domain-containing protein [Prosthecobacter sp.]|uniref:DUF3592 domain-containing protein n=1 Tax=Prosthecobacter sp. TaxID=1965333 RepID=UPI003BAEF543